jgi:hypothetical protein
MASLVCHPDAVRWWINLNQLARSPWDQFGSFSFRSNSMNFSNWQMWLSQLIWMSASFPFVTWLFATALLILAGQIVWQGRRGLTVGKWLCGIRVLRPTLRPCGIPKSLLREILLVPESLFLMTYVPAIVAMLITRHCRRFGDCFADTIVIRQSRIAAKMPAGGKADFPLKPAITATG